MKHFTKIWINGDEVEEISVQHRGFLYGDGIFETMAVQSGEILLHKPHLIRLVDGTQRLGLDVDIVSMRADIEAVAEYVPDDGLAVLKVIVARQPGGRGYQPSISAQADVIIMLSFWEASDQPISLMLCNTILGNRPALAGLKTLNALEYVLAASELGEVYGEGLLCDQDGFLVEGTKSNLFWVNEEGILLTPEIRHAGLAGVVRNELLTRLEAQSLPFEEVKMTPDILGDAQEIFLTNSLIGVQSVGAFQQKKYKHFPTAEKCRKLLKGAIFETQ